jgi:hypothetical protein
LQNGRGIISVTHQRGPNKENIKHFYKNNGQQGQLSGTDPLLHGTGRAEMYSALYRIEYESFTNEAARQG